MSNVLKHTHANKFDLYDADKHIPASVQDDILRAINRELGVKSLAAEMHQHFRISNMGKVSNYMFHTPSLLDVLKLVVKYQKVLRTDYTISYSVNGAVTTYSVKVNGPAGEGKSIYEEIDILRIIDGMRQIAGRNFVPLEIGITASTSKHLQHSFPHGDYPIKTGQDKYWILFDSRYLFKKPPRIFEEEVAPESTIIDGSAVSMIEYLLRSFSPGYVPSLTQLGKMLGMSRRTIERELEKEQTSYLAIKNSFLQQRSLELMEDPGLSIKEISQFLGYSNSQNYIRAFRTWYGVTPAQYRNSL